MKSSLPVKESIEDEEEGEESDRGSQIRYVSSLRVNPSTDPYVSATTGSPDVISHKVSLYYKDILFKLFSIICPVTHSLYGIPYTSSFSASHSLYDWIDHSTDSFGIIRPDDSAAKIVIEKLGIQTTKNDLIVQELSERIGTSHFKLSEFLKESIARIEAMLK
ncbi:hypothetical protein MKW98_001346 [Papaver atlanticum]|uniref:Uncharacterized protein n=1 Tax=Papaver atlanticum TaxID=357466 RepID=A0AAD4SRU6_9MAGN|nr:hypothetical protein MKW98_001346 [Papaver atlanticum]